VVGLCTTLDFYEGSDINLTTVIIALLSGLIGAGATAYLNYKIRLAILEKQKLEKDTKVAYVHLVQITDYVAIELLAKHYGQKIEAAIKESDELKIPDGVSFTMSHGIAAGISDMLGEVEDEKLDKMAALSNILDPFIDGFDKLDLSIDELTNMPKLNVEYYHQFNTHANHIRSTLKVLKVAVESKNMAMISPETVHGLWLSGTRFFDAASKLRTALIYSSKLRPEVAHKMLTERYTEMWENVQAGFNHDAALKEALEYIKSQEDEKSNKTN